MKDEKLRNGCQWLIREMTRMSELQRPLTIEEFYRFAENEIFIKTLFKKNRDIILGLDMLDENNQHCDKEVLAYMENAFSRHANVVLRETYGVKNNAYLLAINIAAAISREPEQ